MHPAQGFIANFHVQNVFFQNVLFILRRLLTSAQHLLENLLLRSWDRQVV